MATIKMNIVLDGDQFHVSVRKVQDSLGRLNKSLADTEKRYGSLVNALKAQNSLKTSLFSSDQITKMRVAMEELSKSTKSTARGLTDAHTASRGFLATMRDVSIVTGAVSMVMSKLSAISNGWIGDIVRLNAHMERLTYQMRSMSSAPNPFKDASDTIKFLQEQAKEMPFSLKTITDGFVKMKATGIDPMAGGLKALADGVAAAGGSDQELERAILAVTQMSGKGVIQMEELRQQLGEAMPRAVELMARSMGVSMATLISEIGKGTVEAKPALAAFFAEVERTYGGQAITMMHTFTGQMQRATTQLQQLATTGTIKESFFSGALRQQLQDFNRFLDSDAAIIWRDKIGNALTAGVNAVRWFIDTIIEFREEIGRLGSVVLAVFGMSAAISGLRGLRAVLLPTTEQVAALTTAYTNFKAASANVALASNMNAPIIARSATRFGQVTSAVKLGITAFAAYAPLIGVAALAAFTAAEYFGLLSDKTKEAYESLKTYGAESKAQAERTVADRRKTLQARLDSMEAVRPMARPGSWDEDIKKTKEELARLDREAGDIIAKAANREAGKAIDEYKVLIESKLATLSGSYDQAFIEFTKKWDDLEKQAIESGESVDEVRKSRAEATLEMEKKSYDDRIKVVEEFLATERKRLGIGSSIEDRDDQTQKILRQRVGYLQKILADLYRASSSLNTPEVPTVAKGPDEQKLYEKGLKYRDKLKAELESLREEAEGGYSAIAKLEAEIAQGKYGPNTDRVRQLAEEMRALIQQSEEQKRLNKEIEENNRLYENAQDKLAKMKAEVAGMFGEMQGVNQETAKLRALAEQGFFGDKESEKVKELVDQLEQAADAKAALDKLMDGKKKLEDDIEANRIDLIEREMALKERAAGEELSRAEKIKLRFEAGYYEGFGPSSPTRAMLEGIVKSFDIQGTAAENVGKVVRDNTFGSSTLTAIDTVVEHLKTMLGVMTGIGKAASGITFNNMGIPGLMGQNLPGALTAPVQPTQEVGLLMRQAMEMLTAKGWSPTAAAGIVGNLAGESSLNVNARARGDGRDGSDSIGIAQWNAERARGLQQYAMMSGRPWNDLQTQIDYLDHELRSTHSSAATAINGAATPGQAAESFMRLFERPAAWAMQQSIGKRQGYAQTAFNMASGTTTNGQTVDTSLPPVPDPAPYQSSLAQIQAAWNETTATLKKKIDEQVADYEKLEDKELSQNRVEALKELKSRAEDAQRPIEELGKNYQDMLEKIRAGELGKSKDVNAEEYKAILEAAQELDTLEKKRDETIKARNQSQQLSKRLTEQEVELQRRATDAMNRIKDPNARVQSDEYRKLEQDLNEYVAEVKRAYGATSDVAIQAEQRKQTVLRQLRGTESAELAAKWQKETRDANISIMGQTASRRATMQQEIAAIDREVAAFQGSEQQKVAFVEAAEARKASIRAQYAQQDPMGKQMAEWQDMETQLANMSTQWMDSLAGGLTDLIMGTGDLKSVIQGMIRDLLNMGIKYLMSSMVKGLKGGTTGKTSSTATTAKSGATKTGSKLATGGKVGVAHTGGIIGASSLATRFASGGMFKNARKFHTGGFIGGMPKLKSDEVPIIARKGEGVFTPEQMRALGKGAGGAGSIQISAPITVNGSAGTPEQNNDLARKMRRESEQMMRGLVADEIFKQRRPGNILNR